MTIDIAPDGTVRMIYDESVDLSDLGPSTTRRASHVEPDPQRPGSWVADLSPVGGPILSGFGKRSEALAAEVDWLERNYLNGPSGD